MLHCPPASPAAMPVHVKIATPWPNAFLVKFTRAERGALRHWTQDCASWIVRVTWRMCFSSRISSWIIIIRGRGSQQDKRDSVPDFNWQCQWSHKSSASSSPSASALWMLIKVFSPLLGDTRKRDAFQRNKIMSCWWWTHCIKVTSSSLGLGLKLHPPLQKSCQSSKRSRNERSSKKEQDIFGFVHVLHSLSDCLSLMD